MLLVIETATAALSVALIEDGRIVASHHEIVGRGHAERLMPVIAGMLGDRRPRSIAIDCGPGSFTGVRVGLAAAQGLRMAWGVAATGFLSTALVAAGARHEGEIAVALTGGHGEQFIEMFTSPPLGSTGPMRSLPTEDAARAIAAPRIFGSGAPAIIAVRGWGEAIEAWPRATDFVHLPPAFAALPLRPIYGRAPDARPPLRVPA